MADPGYGEPESRTISHELSNFRNLEKQLNELCLKVIHKTLQQHLYPNPGKIFLTVGYKLIVFVEKLIRPSKNALPHL